MLYRLLMIAALTGLLFSSVLAYDPPPPPNYPIGSLFPQLQNEEQMFVSPTDSNIVIAVWRDFRLGFRRVGLGRSTDAGATWTDSLITMRRYNRVSDPTIDVDADGNFYICNLEFDNAGFGSALTFYKSTDQGVSWTTGGVIDGNPYGPSPYFEDKQFITIDRTGGTYDGNIYVGWARFFEPNTGDRIFFSRSTDGAATFPDTLEIGPNPNFTSCGHGVLGYTGQFTQPLVGSDGSVYVFWVGMDTLDCNLEYTTQMVKSTDGGATFTTPKSMIYHSPVGSSTVDGGVNVYFAPAGAADITGGPYDGNLYISYGSTDSTNIGVYDWNVYFIKSADGGATWSERITINDDLTGPGAIYDQFHPWLFCNEDGILVSIFYDQRIDVAGHLMFDLFAAYSFDGGQTFTSNHRISDVSSDPWFLNSHSVADTKGTNNPWSLSVTVSPQAGLIGEYICVTAFKDHNNAIWTDTRNGNSDTYGANWVTPMLDARLFSPATGDTTLDTPTLTWATAWKQYDDHYRLEVATDSQFTNIVFSDVTDTNFMTVTTPLSDLRHYWRVKAFMISSGDSTDYSDPWQFLVDAVVCHDPDEDGFGTPGEPGNACPDDNCPNTYNPGQEDIDNDGTGDACCCLNLRGNASNDPEDKANVSDVSYLVSWLFGIPSGPAPSCIHEANANSDFEEKANVSDVSYMVAWLFGIPTGPAPGACP